MISSGTPKPVPPNAVRVWRGFKNHALSATKFFEDLGSVFVPATVELQWPSGLDAYIPSFPAGKGKPASVPDETAVLFWDSQLAYKNGFNTLAIRTYTMTHGSVYDTQNKESTADFAELYQGSLSAGQPYYFFPESLDWMQGTVFHLAGGRPRAVTASKFLAALEAWATRYQKENPDRAKGAIVCATADYVVFWACIPGAVGTGKGIAALRRLCTPYHDQPARPVALPAGIFDNYLGLVVRPGDSFNMQFDRRSVTV